MVLYYWSADQRPARPDVALPLYKMIEISEFYLVRRQLKGVGSFYPGVIRSRQKTQVIKRCAFFSYLLNDVGVPLVFISFDDDPCRAP